MENYGTISAQVFTSDAKIPVSGAAVAFFVRENEQVRLLAFRLTNEDGFTDEIRIETPEISSTSQTSTGKAPFSQISIFAEQPGYNRILVENAQIFTGISSYQPLQLVPTPSLPQEYGALDIFRVETQNL